MKANLVLTPVYGRAGTEVGKTFGPHSITVLSCLTKPNTLFPAILTSEWKRPLSPL